MAQVLGPIRCTHVCTYTHPTHTYINIDTSTLMHMYSHVYTLYLHVPSCMHTYTTAILQHILIYTLNPSYLLISNTCTIPARHSYTIHTAICPQTDCLLAASNFSLSTLFLSSCYKDTHRFKSSTI